MKDECHECGAERRFGKHCSCRPRKNSQSKQIPAISLGSRAVNKRYGQPKADANKTNQHLKDEQEMRQKLAKHPLSVHATSTSRARP